MAWSELNQNQRAFVQALIDDPSLSYRDAAERAGVAERTGYRYAADLTVRRALSEAQSVALAGVTRRTVNQMATAMTTLADIAGDSEAPATARVSAARAILDYAVKLIELSDLSERVAEVERILIGEEAL